MDMPVSQISMRRLPAGVRVSHRGNRRRSVPRHVGIIPDGNRRWAGDAGLNRQDGYFHGIEPGIRLYHACRAAGIEELSVYGFTKDNVRRPSPQVTAFRNACVALAERLIGEGAALRVVGDRESKMFPEELRDFVDPADACDGPRVNLLVNYGWSWDLEGMRHGKHRTADIPALDLVIRWGGGRRLSGFLPVQSVYADFYIVDSYWPDFRDRHLDEALSWYTLQDRTLGG